MNVPPVNVAAQEAPPVWQNFPDHPPHAPVPTADDLYRSLPQDAQYNLSRVLKDLDTRHEQTTYGYLESCLGAVLSRRCVPTKPPFSSIPLLLF